jgi:hypothetical protein
VIEAIKKGRGQFNTAARIGEVISNYTKLVEQKGNPQDKQNYNRYFLEILLGLYKNFYDNQKGKTPIVKLDIPAVISALLALGERQQDLGKPEKLESIQDILTELNLADFKRGIKAAGDRGWVLRGNAARLSRAITNFILDFWRKKGYYELVPPYYVNEENLDTFVKNNKQLSDQLTAFIQYLQNSEYKGTKFKRP